MHSCIYTGKVRHRRLAPVDHEFSYGIYLLLLDLDEIDHVFSKRMFWSTNGPNFAWFRRKDHLRSLAENGSSSLKESIAEFLQSRGIQCDGPVRLLTQLRYLGFVMNPVSFYYCYANDGVTLKAVVAQVNNTPWGEEHLYLITEGENGTGKRLSADKLDKEFHVSPFLPMDMHYNMQFSNPGDKLAVRMVNFRSSTKMLNVVMTLKRKPISTLNLMSVLLSYPLISFRVFGAIYWQALRIYLKKIPFFPHPRKGDKAQYSDHGLVQSSD